MYDFFAYFAYFLNSLGIIYTEGLKKNKKIIIIIIVNRHHRHHHHLIVVIVVLSSSSWNIPIALGPDYKKILRLSYDVITYDNRKSNLR